MLGHIPVGRPCPDLLVGLQEPDDAAVYRLDGGRAVVASLDFFTPLVDGPEDFGAIAAANALSDLYAMHASPLFALNILAVPAGELPEEVVAGILAGAAAVCDEAGIPIAGGHSIDDPEPKFGLVAIGVAEEARLYRKSGGRPGDCLVLGKALGTGVITTGVKRNLAPPVAEASAIRSMRRLNRDAAEVLEDFAVHAATDVTGYGLLGHLREMCRASDAAALVRADGPILLPGARELAAEGCVPGGTTRNRAAVEPEVAWGEGIPEGLRILLCDAQTSGGLLVAVPEEEGEALVAALRERDYQAARIGRLVPRGEGPRIRVEGPDEARGNPGAGDDVAEGEGREP